MNIKLYTKPNCSFCEKAKSFLSLKGISYDLFKLDEQFTTQELVEMFPSAKSFPVIVVDGQYIGGYSQLVEHLDVSPSSMLSEHM